MLVDLTQYLIGLRQAAELTVDSIIGFKERNLVPPELPHRRTPAQAAAITPRVGSATLSPFVTLATRS